MESVWWVFKTLVEKGLVYRGYKVMPYSTACTTPLSNFEAGLNYKDVADPAVIVSFPLKDDPEVCMRGVYICTDGYGVCRTVFFLFFGVYDFLLLILVSVVVAFFCCVCCCLDVMCAGCRWL